MGLGGHEEEVVAAVGEGEARARDAQAVAELRQHQQHQHQRAHLPPTHAPAPADSAAAAVRSRSALRSRRAGALAAAARNGRVSSVRTGAGSRRWQSTRRDLLVRGRAAASPSTHPWSRSRPGRRNRAAAHRRRVSVRERRPASGRDSMGDLHRIDERVGIGA